MIIYSIYKCTNNINNKVYIGFSKNVPIRIKDHINDSKYVNNKFYYAVRKYGWDNFEWELLYQSLDGQYTLDVMEPYFISEYDSFHNGYNSTKGGGGVVGIILSEESKQKISKSRTGQIGNFTNKVHSPESKLRISNAMKGRPSPHKGKESKTKGRKWSPELREKMKLAAQKRWENTPKVVKPPKIPKLPNHLTTKECKYCGTSMGLNNFYRYHDENCKQKTSSR